MVAFDPPSVMELRWEEDETLRLEVAPSGSGCVLTLINRFDEIGKAARDAAGWHECLDVLECRLAGESPPFEDGERWQAVHPGYVERFGPEAATIGPPAERCFAAPVARRTAAGEGGGRSIVIDRP